MYNYLTAYKDLEICSSDCIYVASSSLSLFWNRNFINDICESLFNYFDSGTIVMPTFSSDFRIKKIFNPMTSKSICGLVSEYYRILPNIRRTCYSPLHTVSSHGKLSNDIMGIRAESSFGKTSVFEYLKEIDATVLLIDCSFYDGTAFINALEEKYESSYRYWETLTGDIIKDEYKETISIKWFAKRLDKNSSFNSSYVWEIRRNNSIKLGKTFFETKLVRHIICNKTNFICFKLSDFYNFFEPLFQKDKDLFLDVI